jgi:hypothetical protein
VIADVALHALDLGAGVHEPQHERLGDRPRLALDQRHTAAQVLDQVVLGRADHDADLVRWRKPLEQRIDNRPAAHRHQLLRALDQPTQPLRVPSGRNDAGDHPAAASR